MHIVVADEDNDFATIITDNDANDNVNDLLC